MPSFRIFFASFARLLGYGSIAVRDAGVLEMEEKVLGLSLTSFFASSQLLLSTFPNLNRVTMATETRKKSNKLRNNPIKENVLKIAILSVLNGLTDFI